MAFGRDGTPPKVSVQRGAFAFNKGPEMTTFESGDTTHALSEAARRSHDAYMDVASTGSYHNPDKPIAAPPTKGRGMLVGSNVNMPEPTNFIPAAMPKDITSQSPFGRALEVPRFQPGVPGTPRSEKTVHQMMKDEDLVAMAQTAIADWQASNPGRRLKSPAFKAMLKDQFDLSDAQARRFLQRLTSQAGS